MLPQANAQLTSIDTGASVEDWDTPASAGTTNIWSGATDAYVIEKVRTVYAGNEGGLLKQKDIRIIISSNLVDDSGNPLQVNPDDVVTYVFRNTTHVRHVEDMEAPYLPGLGIQEYIILHLRPEAVETALESE